MIVVRVFGMLLAAAAVMIGGIDLAHSWSGSGMRLTGLGRLWHDLAPGSLGFTQAVVQRHLPAVVWDPIMRGLLALPAFAVFGTFGALLILIPRRDAPRRRTYAR